MRDFVKISQTIWKSKKFKSLPDDDARYCYLYILTCPHASSAGCFDLPLEYLCTDMKWEKDRALKSIVTLCETALIQFNNEENTVFIENWLEFNSPANPKHAIGMLSQLKQVSSDSLKRLCGEQIKNVIVRKKFDKEQIVRGALASFFDSLLNGIATETETRRETETQTETILDLDKTKTAEIRPTALRLLPEGQSLTPIVSETMKEAAKRIGAL